MTRQDPPHPATEETLLDTGASRRAGETESTSFEAGGRKGAGPSDRTVLDTGPAGRNPSTVPSTGPDLGSKPRAARQPTTAAAPPIAIDASASWDSVLEPGAERFTFLERLRIECGRTVDLVLDRDLGREVEFHRPGPGLPHEALVEVRHLLARLRHPALPVFYGGGTDDAGAPYLVVARSPGAPIEELLRDLQRGILSLERRRRLLAALIEVARGLHSARATVGAHRGISTRSIWVDEEGRVTLMGWGARWADAKELAAYAAPELRSRGGTAGPVADVYSLGLVAAEVVLGRPIRPIGRHGRFPPWFPPELRQVILRATEHRPSQRHPDLATFATALEQALRGERVTGGRLPLRRRVQRVAKRHPYLTMSVLFAALGAAFLGIQTAFEEAGQAEATLQSLEEDVGSIEELARSVEDGTIEQAKSIAAWREKENPEAKRGAWIGRLDVIQAAQLEREKVLAVLERGRIDYARLDYQVDRFDEWYEANAPKDSGHARDLERKVRRLRVEAALARAEVELEFLLADEQIRLSGRTLPSAVATGRVHELLAAGADPEADLDRELEGLVSNFIQSGLYDTGVAWREAARLLAQASGGADDASSNRWTRLLGALEPTATLRIGTVPVGCRATLARVIPGSAGHGIRLEAIEEIGRSCERRLDMGYYVLLLERDGREVRHPVMIGRGETCELVPAWPAEFPPGDFVYVPAGRFRAGGGEPSSPYREELVAHGFFIARNELTCGDYLEYYRALRPGQAIPNVDPRQPMAVTREIIEEYANWLGSRAGNAWRYRIPTDAEWEFAARGAAGWVYPWGDEWMDDEANPDRARHLMPAGSFPAGASVFGLLDTMGNQREFAGPDEEEKYVFRGGCWGVVGSTNSLTGRQYLDPAPPNQPRVADGVRLVCVKVGED